MKRSALLERFGDAVLSKVVVNIGVAGEIELGEDDPSLPEHHVVSFHADATASALKFSRDGKGQVILTLDPASFVIDSVVEPPEPPATEPMIGPDGESLLGDDPAPGEGFDALEGKPKRGKKAAEPKRCPHPNCMRPEEHDGDHEFPTEDPNE